MYRSKNLSPIVGIAFLVLTTTENRAQAANKNIKVCVQVSQKDLHERTPVQSKSAAKPEPKSVPSTQKKSVPSSQVPPKPTEKNIDSSSWSDDSPVKPAPSPNAEPGTGEAKPSEKPQVKDEKSPSKDLSRRYTLPITENTAGSVSSPALQARRPVPPTPSDGDVRGGWDQAHANKDTSIAYIKRLVEYFVSHEPGYEAVQDQCQETIFVELYPLTNGWTAFARFSKTGREERIDHLYPDELSPFAERAVTSLLQDVPISETISRTTVLRSDSKQAKRKIKGNSHFILAVGTQLRGGMFDTAVTEEGNPNRGSVERKVRVFAPMQLMMGYRGRFETWGIETTTHLGLGTAKTSASRNPEGGHVDLGANAGLSLHFLRYFNPKGITSLYGGAGGTFELIWFSAVKTADRISEDRRDYLFTGGLGIDAVLGMEFMRASAVQFFIQGALNLPAHVIQSENAAAKIHTWFPGLTIQLGVVF